MFWLFTVLINSSSDREKLLKFGAEGQEFAECLRSVYSSSEMSEQFLVTECFFLKFIPGVSQI